MVPVLETLVVGPLAVNCYLFGDPDTDQALLIDPGEEAALILEAVREGGWKVGQVVLTHAHFDHVLAASEVISSLGASFGIPAGEEEMLRRVPETVRMWMGGEVQLPPEPDHLLKDGDVITVGSLRLSVAATPGHSPGGICLLADGIAFVGDTLFAGSIGRTDLPGGDYDRLIGSIRERLLCLPDDTTVYPGHGPATTIGQERRSNPFLTGLTE